MGRQYSRRVWVKLGAMASKPVRISLVIPAYNEEAYLPALLQSVEAARQRYVHGADRIEVIVGDNLSTDRTAAIARGFGYLVASVEKRCIGAARNGGANVATGEILCFIDADSRIEPETFNAIDAVMQTGKVAIGATGVVPDRTSAGIRATIVIFEVVGRMIGLDTGVIFCRREDFVAIGGYDETRLAAEDVDLLFRLKAYGRKQGRRFVRLPAVRAVTSARKFDTHGDWHALRIGLRVAWQMLFDRKNFDRYAKSYWYDVR
jgi:glycosyltransferase involved in cell wall biosynthesis